MSKTLLFATACVALVGAALAQVATTSNTFLLDVDPARYAGPAGQRIAVLVGDEPRHIALSAQDEICVQLQRSATDGSVINARVRALRPEPHAAVSVRVVAPDISPGTFRSTPWGMLLRVVAEQSAATGPVKPLGIADAPVCAL